MLYRADTIMQLSDKRYMKKNHQLKLMAKVGIYN